MKCAKHIPFSVRRAKRLKFSLINQSSIKIPTEKDFLRWIFATLEKIGGKAVISLMLCDEEAARSYNRDYRGKDYATNVLSFVLDEQDTPHRAAHFCGDLLICPPVVMRESTEQGKTTDAHYAHLTIHGTLHLAGFDHVDDADAQEMEALEIAILNQLGYANPYI